MSNTEDINSRELVKDAEIPAYRFYPILEGIVISILMSIAFSITTFFIYDYSRKALNGEIREGLARTALVTSFLIDGDLQRRFISRAQESTADYERALQPLLNIQRSDASIATAYTTVMREGKVYFMLDATPTGDADEDGLDDKGHIMQEYFDAPVEMRDAFRLHRVVTTKDPYQDRWGTYMAAFAPFYDSSGHFAGIAAIEINARNYRARLGPLNRITLFAFLAGEIIAFAVGFIVWFLRGFSRRIHTSRMKIYAELLIERKQDDSSCQKDEPARGYVQLPKVIPS